MNFLHKLSCGVLLAIALTQSHADEVESKADLGDILQDAVLCKPGTIDHPAAVDTFNSSDEDTANMLTKLGVTIHAVRDADGYNGRETRYALPVGVTFLVMPQGRLFSRLPLVAAASSMSS